MANSARSLAAPVLHNPPDPDQQRKDRPRLIHTHPTNSSGNHPPPHDGSVSSAPDSDDHLNKEKTFQGLRALIVEDHPVDQKVIMAAANQLGLRPYIVGDASQALDKLRQADGDDPFQLVLMDFKIPDLDGLVASNLIKNQERLQHSPKIVLLSSYQKSEIFYNVTDRDYVDDFISKPITQVNLQSALQQLRRKAAEAGEDWPIIRSTQSIDDDDILARTHILLAEDNPINQKVATGILKQKSVQVTVANNGQEAIDKIFNACPGTYDLILMDMDMPVVDGIEATLVIHGHPDYKNLPIIALTAHVSPSERDKCLQAGMAEHLAKPIKPETLYNTIRQHLQE